MVKKKQNPKCEVTETKRCHICGNKNYSWVCGKKGVIRIRDVVCNHVSKSSFWVCKEHKTEFLKQENEDIPHYKEVRKRAIKGRK